MKVQYSVGIAGGPAPSPHGRNGRLRDCLSTLNVGICRRQMLFNNGNGVAREVQRLRASLLTWYGL